MSESRVVEQKDVLVTVGTTKFEALISSLDENFEKFIDYLVQEDYTCLTIQIGTGTFEPRNLISYSKTKGIRVNVIRFSNDFAEIMRTSGLIISHAGAGSILEALRMPHNPKLLVVVNTLLMDNHQLELAEALNTASSGPYLVHAIPGQIVEILQSTDWSLIKPYPPIDADLFPGVVAEELELLL